MKTKTKLLALATCAACIVFSPTAKAQSFTDEQKQELEVIFKEFLAQNPQAILDSVDQYRAEQERKSQQSAQENLKEYLDFYKNTDLPMAGNPEGDVTVVEYFDYNCGYCRKAFSDIQAVLRDDSNVRVIFQEMPILSPSSKKMAEYALAAHKQGKYFEMHKALMDYKGTQTDEAYTGLAEKIGLNLEQLKTDMANPDIEEKIKKYTGMARDIGIRGTPGFIIGDKIYPGYIGESGMKKAIAEARESQAKSQ